MDGTIGGSLLTFQTRVLVKIIFTRKVEITMTAIMDIVVNVIFSGISLPQFSHFESHPIISPQTTHTHSVLNL